jgi:hypothetical protein
MWASDDIFISNYPINWWINAPPQRKGSEQSCENSMGTSPSAPTLNIIIFTTGPVEILVEGDGNKRESNSRQGIRHTFTFMQEQIEPPTEKKIKTHN